MTDSDNDNEPILPEEFAEIEFLAVCCDLTADELIHRATKNIPFEISMDALAYQIALLASQSEEAKRRMMNMEPVSLVEVADIALRYAWSLRILEDMVKTARGEDKELLADLEVQKENLRETLAQMLRQNQAPDAH